MSVLYAQCTALHTAHARLPPPHAARDRCCCCVAAVPGVLVGSAACRASGIQVFYSGSASSPPSQQRAPPSVERPTGSFSPVSCGAARRQGLGEPPPAAEEGRSTGSSRINAPAQPDLVKDLSSSPVFIPAVASPTSNPCSPSNTQPLQPREHTSPAMRSP